jgi:NADP-dependent 3-hydroxy acid dehydrogenase YdfG
MVKIYLISGAGGGIGRAIAQKLSNDGHTCILMGRSELALKETLNLLAAGKSPDISR